MEEAFKFEIISPEKIIFSNNTTMVALPSYEGDMSVLKYHISIITFLRPGVIKVQTSKNDFEEFFVQDGIVEYFNDSLVTLSASAINVKSVSKDFINNLSKDTLDKLAEKNITDHYRYMLNHKLNALEKIRP